MSWWKGMRPPGFLRRAARWVLADELVELSAGVKKLSESSARDRSRLELGIEIAHDFERARASAEYADPFTVSEPLVSVIIATYNRAQLVVERSVESLLAQTYEKLQIIVVGDNCTDDTFDRIAAIGDARIEAINLPVRGPYPEDPLRRWMVAGSPAMNEGLRRAQGHWVTHLDDDDKHAPHRVERLVEIAQRSRAELLWHPFRYQVRGQWALNPALDFAAGSLTTSAIFYHRWLTRIGWDMDAHYSLEPGDWNRLRKFKWLNVRCERVDEPLLDHYEEMQNQ